ncbi:hypothetical protein TNCV_4560741 [Trichonephila clavipes]|nr:hypothetical protein TNCV_4560741 [Trichonephila clavipes]
MPSCHSVHDLELAVQDLWAHLPKDNIRRREESPEEKEAWTVADRDWSGKRGETLNANGVEEPETMNAGSVGGLESMV